MDTDIIQHFSTDLNDQEKLLWCGNPASNLFFEYKDFWNLLPHFLFPALLISFFLRSTKVDISLFGVIILVLFLSPSLIVLLGKFVIAPCRQRKTFYAITDKRIIIKSGILNKNTKSLYLRDLKEINLSLRKNGKGTLNFGNSIEAPWQTKYDVGGYYMTERNIHMPQFEMIENANKIYDLIVKLKNDAADEKSM